MEIRLLEGYRKIYVRHIPYVMKRCGITLSPGLQVRAVNRRGKGGLDKFHFMVVVGRIECRGVALFAPIPSLALCPGWLMALALRLWGPGLVIDWLEDTGSLLPILEESAPPALPIRYDDEGGGGGGGGGIGGGGAWAEGGAETVHLPGGCTISDAQYSQLQDFMKTPSIENCMCNKGEVVCAVKLFKT
ncbi:uncharacterized protein LOC134787998 [Penaeus indicus]|uniref:uncharacterized protein LOC134787998 n=1 Tax=Penaeus indicus TaxID=29960 RepID=UPI00300D0255